MRIKCDGPSGLSTQPLRRTGAARKVVGRVALLAAVLSTVLLTACRQDMHDQPKYIPLRPSDFFGDGRSERSLVEGAVARGHLDDDNAYFTGRGPDGKFVDEFPFQVTKEVIGRGQARFNIYCAPCHDRLGNGDGKIVRRGYRHPPSYHIDRLRQVPNGYIYDVITSGFGAMPDYSAQIKPADRWAIVAYVRALQLAQNGKIDDVPSDRRGDLNQEAGQ
ncbi:MAG TPA: cytochrome c [Bryobacteraceae bacterium]|nr:cytochrome c [Bryobacteraceae bacterium]